MNVNIFSPRIYLLLICIVLVSGCGDRNTKTSSARAAEKYDNLIISNYIVSHIYETQYVSIGYLDVVDWQHNESVLSEFFASNGIVCLFNGTVILDVEIFKHDFNKARDILKTNMPSVATFHSTVP